MEKLTYLSLYIPLIGSLICFLLLLVKLVTQWKLIENRALFALSTCFLLLQGVFYINVLLAAHNHSVSIAVFDFFCVTLVPVIFYHIIILTKRKDFSILNYILPVIFFSLYSIWKVSIPSSIESASLLNTKSEIIDSFQLFHYLGNEGIYVSISITTYFVYQSMKKSIHFIKESALDLLFRGDLQWLFNVAALFAFINILYFSLNLSFIGSNGIYIVITLLSFLSFFLSTALCYNLFTENFPSSKNILNGIPESEGDYLQSIDKKKFEKYIKEQRPHLNSHLKITDFAKDIGTNRTYLSRFINENYGVNFSTYINRLRLAEMKELKASPSYKGLPDTELVYIAGFKSYSSYQKTVEKLNSETEDV